MKKIVKIFILIFAILLPSATSTVKAATDTVNLDTCTDITQIQIIHEDNGGYFVETLESTPYSLDDVSMLSTRADSTATTTTKTKTKTVKYYNSKNVLCWSYSLTATFSIKLGNSATYKSSKASLDNSNDWTVVSESHSGSGAKASGTIKMKKNGTTLSRTVTIQCDKNGNFS